VSTARVHVAAHREPGKTNGNGKAHAPRPPYEWDTLPSELLAQGHFVVYRNVPEAGKKDRKVPYQPKNPAARAKINDPSTWDDFRLARAACNTHSFDGLNFVTCPQFTAVDLDHCVTDGQPSAEARALMAALPNTYWELSPSGTGLHGIFRSTDVKNLTGRTPGGQSVEVYAGNHFMSVTGWVLRAAPVAELKPEHVELYRVNPTPTTKASAGQLILEGERNSALLTLAGAMRQKGATTDAIAVALMQTNKERCRPPLDDKRIGKILNSIAKYQAGDLLAPRLTDAGNAERLLHYGEGDYAYIAAFDRWVVWDGTRWPVDDKEQQHMRAEAHDMAHLFIMQAAAAVKEDKPATKEVLKFATGCLNTSRINNMLREAQPHAIRKVEELDRDPLLVNFLNGTLDARTGELREHRREDGITKIIPFNYDAEAPCPRWETFLATTFENSKQLVEFFQRAVGYSLTGLTLEKCLFLAQGPTDTAKTTTMKIIGDLVGEYAGCIRVESLMAERGRAMDNNAKDDLADLRGTRLVRTSETAEGQRLREELVKELTQGQGKFKAVRKFESHFEFPETWKIWMDCNHQPVVRGTDDAIWNRLIVIPFNHQIAKADINPRLGAELIAEEAEGILAWMVRGLSTWRTDGLELPEVMARQRKEWREASDDMGQFLSACSTTQGSGKVPSTRLYDAYTQWRSENGYSWVESTVVFARKMSERGFTKKNVGDKKIPTWFGLNLTPAGEFSAQQGAGRREMRAAKAANA
jgi:putative DNA primase/helicase